MRPEELDKRPAASAIWACSWRSLPAARSSFGRRILSLLRLRMPSYRRAADVGCMRTSLPPWKPPVSRIRSGWLTITAVPPGGRLQPRTGGSHGCGNGG